MIELKVNNVVLPLPPGLQLTRELETTIFNRELTVTDFTYPVDMPLTDDAIVALGFPNSLANPKLKQDYVCDFIVDGIYLDQVVLRVLKVSLVNKVASVSLIGKYGAFARLLGATQVNQLELGGVRTIGVMNSGPVGGYEDLTAATPSADYAVLYKDNTAAAHIFAVNQGTTVTDYVFGQAVDTNNTLQMQGTGLNIINEWSYYNVVGAGGFSSGSRDPIRQYLLNFLHGINTDANNPVEDRYWWVPQFRLSYVLQKCFSEFGLAVSGAILTDANFKKIVLHNTFSINKCSFTYSVISGYGLLAVTHDATKIDPKNHVPKMTVLEFIQEVAKAFNLHYDIDLRNSKVEIKQIANANSYGAVVDISARASPEPTLDFEEQDYTRGFEFSFAQTTGATVNEDWKNFPFIGYQPTLQSLSFIVSANIDDIAFVNSENAFYQYDGYDWGFYSDNLGKCASSTKENLLQIVSKIAPARMSRDSISLIEYTYLGVAYYPSGDWQVNPFTAIGMCGTGIFTFDFSRVLATGASNADRMKPCFSVVNEPQPDANPVMLNWHGMQAMTTGTEKYPLLSSTVYDVNGLPLNGYVLAWQAAAASGFTLGLYPKWWKTFAASFADSVEAEYLVMIDPILYNNVDFNGTVFQIDGLQFLCKKATIVMPFPDVAMLQLVRV